MKKDTFLTRVLSLLVFCIVFLGGQHAAVAQNNASFVSQSVPSTMVAGQTYAVSITFANTGTTDWTTAANYLLGSQNPIDNRTWGMGRVALTATVTRGSQTTFTFNVKAPSTTGTYNFQWQMLRESVEWFGTESTNIAITVVPEKNDAQFVSQSVPATMVAGQTYNISVTYKNSGSKTWTSSEGHALGSQNPQDNIVWRDGRVWASTPVPPGQQYTFTFPVKAPTTPGTYAFQWRMLQQSVEWFGNATPTINIAVSGTQQAAPTITVQRNPSPLLAGQVFTTSWSTTNATGVKRVCTSTGTGFTDNVTLATSGSTSATANKAWVGYPSNCTWTVTGTGGSKSYIETVSTVQTTNKSQFVSQSVPTSMTAGKVYSVSVTMKNIGTSTWTAAGYHGLGSQNPGDNATWRSNRVPLPNSVAPNQQVTFNFTVTAPAINGTYNFQWAMVQDYVEWFGPASTNVAVAVTGGKTASETITYFHNDLSGSPIAATTAEGALLWKQNYLPYGETLNPVSSSTVNSIGFAGKPFDVNTGLSYMGARYYDPVLGRFAAVDPAGFDPDNLHSFNRYTYANNNPYKYVDPDGHSPVDVAFLAYDLGKLGVAMYTGVGVGSAVADVAMSVVGVASPIPGTGEAMKVARALERGVEVTKAIDRTADVAKAGGAAENVIKESRYYSQKERQMIYKRAEGKCEYCGKELQFGRGQGNSMEADHIVPWRKGGRTTMENAAAACRDCNRSKGAKELGKEWIPPKDQPKLPD